MIITSESWSTSEASRKQDVSAPEGGDSHGSTEPILVGSGVGDPMWPLTRTAYEATRSRWYREGLAVQVFSGPCAITASPFAGDGQSLALQVWAPAVIYERRNGARGCLEA